MQKKRYENRETCRYVITTRPGERVGFDLLDLGTKGKIILGVDYFSRTLFRETINTKEATKIVKFLDETHKKFKFECMITDNGQELANSAVKDWDDKKNVRHVFSIPYYHQSNGRIKGQTVP